MNVMKCEWKESSAAYLISKRENSLQPKVKACVNWFNFDRKKCQHFAGNVITVRSVTVG